MILLVGLLASRSCPTAFHSPFFFFSVDLCEMLGPFAFLVRGNSSGLTTKLFPCSRRRFFSPSAAAESSGYERRHFHGRLQLLLLLPPPLFFFLPPPTRCSFFFKAPLPFFSSRLRRRDRGRGRRRGDRPTVTLIHLLFRTASAAASVMAAAGV